jgi:DNA helicase-2/ATP-dependent DNA helicase PcrA
VPLKFALTQQAKNGDAHVYGARSRFITDKVLKAFEPAVHQSAQLGQGGMLDDGQVSSLDASARLKEMW